MNKILDICRQISSKYEIYNQKIRSKKLRKVNNNLEKIYTNDLSQYSIRIIKDNKMTLTTIDENQNPEYLLKIREILPYGTETDFDFPKNTISRENEENKELDYSTEELCKELNDPVSYLSKEIPEKDISAQISQANTETNLINSSGFDNGYKIGRINHNYSISLKNTGERLSRFTSEKDLQEFPKEYLNELIQLYNASKTRKQIPSGNYKVIFSPGAIWSLIWRITSGISGTNLLYNLTPLMDKLEQKVFSDLISIYEDPESTPFDDEGVPTSKKHFFEKGIFKNFIFDLYTASKTNNKPTGNGFKSSFWSNSISDPPAPGVSRLAFEPGNISKKELFDQEKAILIESVIGAHSGNVIQGQYSMGISLGFLIENGEVTSMIDGAMVSGNIYEDFNKIPAVSKELTDLSSTLVPHILFDDIPIVI